MTASKSRLEAPVFIIAAPRSGSTLLFETLARSPDAWTLGDEGHAVFEGISQLDPVHRGFDSNRLTEADADTMIVEHLRAAFLPHLKNREGRPLSSGSSPVRMVEKTPKNTLRVPFLDAVFPDARYIYLFREPGENISSILEVWETGRFVTYPRLPDWEGTWSLLLFPGWPSLRGKPRSEIAAAQWSAANGYAIADLARIPAERCCAVAYADFLADPQGETERLCRFAGLRWDTQLGRKLPLARNTISEPGPGKWKQRAAEMAHVLASVEPLASEARAFVRKSKERTEG